MSLAPLLVLAGTTLGSGLVEPPGAVAPAEQLHTTETDGFALGAGIGNQYALLGVQASYYFQVPHTLVRIVPYLGVGLGFCGNVDAWYCRATLGVLGSWGHRHRIYLGLGFGPVGTFELSLYGEEPVSRSVVGPQLTVGYEYMSFEGLVVRMDVGAAYNVSRGLWSARERVEPTLTLIGLGYKF